MARNPGAIRTGPVEALLASERRRLCRGDRARLGVEAGLALFDTESPNRGFRMAQEPSPNPIATPWHVHPDATHLRVRMEEGFEEFPVVADFAAFFAGNPLSSAGKPAPSGPLPSFQEAV